MDKTLAKELELVEAVKAHLEDGKMARTFEVPDDDDAQIWFKGYNLLTAKPTIYAANVAEDDLVDDEASNPHVGCLRREAVEYLHRAPSAFVHRRHAHAVPERAPAAAFECRDPFDERPFADVVVAHP